MAMIGYISTRFNNLVAKLAGEPQPYNWLVDKSNNLAELARVKHFQRLYDFYMGDQRQILKNMRDSMAVMFKAETLSKMLMPYIDIVRKVIDRTSLAYKEPAERYIDNGNDNYQILLESSDINVKSKQWNRLAKLLDTVYVAPMWRTDEGEQGGHIEFDLFPPHLISVKEDPMNYLEPKEIIYTMKMGDKTVKVFWSDSENFYLNMNGEKVQNDTNPNGQNPYQVLPFVPCRLRATENHWGEGDTQLVDIAEKSSILLASTYFNAIMQSHGQAVAINLGLKQDIKGNFPDISIGPDTVIHVEQASKDMAPPSFSFAQPQPATEASLKQIDWMIKTAAIMRGLTPDSVSIDTQAQSGAAKQIDNYELMELRQDDIEALRLFEKKLFFVTAKVWNYHNKGKQIPVDAQFTCDFEEIEMPISEKDELDAKLVKYDLGLWTPVDDLIDEDEGIDEAAAVKQIEDNLALKKQFGAIATPAALKPFGLGASQITAGLNADGPATLQNQNNVGT